MTEAKKEDPISLESLLPQFADDDDGGKTEVRAGPPELDPYRGVYIVSKEESAAMVAALTAMLKKNETQNMAGAARMKPTKDRVEWW